MERIIQIASERVLGPISTVAEEEENSKTVLFVQILCFWTLSIALFLSKTPSCLYISKHSVSETGLFVRLQVKPTLLGPIDRAIPCLRTGDIACIHIFF
jgi:hypothetical protein